MQFINDYLDGKGSLRAICSIYEISNHRVLRNWIKSYNSHKSFKSHNNQGDRIMINGRKTTYEERTEIVSFCISNNNNYQATAELTESEKLYAQLKLIEEKIGA
ncbi:hypothetical protein CLOSAC_39900 [Clostridium saccharobutylicum]|uniref:Transposase n=2 Tax=Clostridium saccharobutylicum TaxID=169679 RepID=A0A1S8MTG0_CLOSA|nr:hypothetical protein CLOSAC_39900 [Clostridium saccharobutylicum]